MDAFARVFIMSHRAGIVARSRKAPPGRVFGHKSKEIEIPLEYRARPRRIADLKQAQITMIILDAFLLQLGALFRRQLVPRRVNRMGRAQLMVSQDDSQPCGALHRAGRSSPFATREINPQL